MIGLRGIQHQKDSVWCQGKFYSTLYKAYKSPWTRGWDYSQYLLKINYAVEVGEGGGFSWGGVEDGEKMQTTVIE